MGRSYAFIFILLSFTMCLASCSAKSKTDFPSLSQLRQSNVALIIEGFQFASGLQKNKDGKHNALGFQLVPYSWVGSGFIASENGSVVTNYHVANKAISAKAMFDDKSTYEINHLTVYDSEDDLAILQMSSNRKFTSVQLGNSELVEPMDQVLAVGNPQGVGINVTKGDVSQVIRDHHRKTQVVRHTAPIAPGNSGGALYKGHQVIGVNASILLASTNFTQFNQAIPINKAITLLKNYGNRKIPLSDVFPTDLDILIKKFETINSATSTIPGAKSSNQAGQKHFTFQMQKLQDYLFFVESPGKDPMLTVTDSQNRLLGYGDLRQNDFDGILLSSERRQNVTITIYNFESTPINVGLKIGYINW